MEGIKGIAIAIAVSAFSLGSLTLIVKSLSRSLPNPKQGTIWTMLVTALKLPVIAIGLYLGAQLQGPALYCFLGTIGLVYSCFVWYLAASAWT